MGNPVPTRLQGDVLACWLRAPRMANPNASAELVYSIIRDTSCHVLKHRQSGRSGMGKRGAEFTLEPNTPTGRNSWKYSGLANPKTVDIIAKEGGGVELVTKSRNPARI